MKRKLIKSLVVILVFIGVSVGTIFYKPYRDNHTPQVNENFDNLQGESFIENSDDVEKTTIDITEEINKQD